MLNVGQNLLEQNIGRLAELLTDCGEQSLLAKFFAGGIVHFIKPIGKKQDQVVGRQRTAGGRVGGFVEQPQCRPMTGINGFKRINSALAALDRARLPRLRTVACSLSAAREF